VEHDGPSQIALDDVGEPAAVLHEDRPIQPELLAERGELARRGQRPEHDLGGVTGNEVGQHEHDERHTDEDERRRDDPLDKVPPHSATVS
jgi:hypothetical protein